MKTLRDIECDYLESILPSEVCAYLMHTYKKEILENGDFFFKLKDYEVMIFDAMEDSNDPEYQGVCYSVDAEGWTNWDDVIYRYYFNAEEIKP